MKIKVWYKNRNTVFGNDNNATRYNVVVSQEPLIEKDLSIRFEFESSVSGKNYNSDVTGGSISIPKRQGIVLATAILSICQEMEVKDYPDPIRLPVDENDIESKCVPWIQIYDLAKFLEVDEAEILAHLPKNMASSAGWWTYISLYQARTISKKIRKKSRKKLGDASSKSKR